MYYIRYRALVWIVSRLSAGVLDHIVSESQCRSSHESLKWVWCPLTRDLSQLSFLQRTSVRLSPGAKTPSRVCVRVRLKARYESTFDGGDKSIHVYVYMKYLMMSFKITPWRCAVLSCLRDIKVLEVRMREWLFDKGYGLLSVCIFVCVCEKKNRE